MIYKIIKHYPADFLIIFVLAAILIIGSETICSFVKESVTRLRPCHNPEFSGIIHTGLAKCGGKFGFYSAHASNHFSIAIFTLLLLKRKIRFYPIFIVIWAVLIAYSRIALGAHYPFDVFIGTISGIALGYIFYMIFKSRLLSFLILKRTSNHSSHD